VGLFRKPTMQLPSFENKIKSPLPLEHIDVTKRYDVYCLVRDEERLYENVRFVAVRTLDDISTGFSNFGGLVEIEATDGTRIMLTKFDIHTVCEHGVSPQYKVVVSWGGARTRPNEPGGLFGPSGP
jgi:hypothetical protein